MRVAIAGGGIGGLTTALALHASGVQAQVFEAARQMRPLGVGINLLPHAVRVLTELGLHLDLSRCGIPTAELIYYNQFGQRIWREPRGVDAGHRWPQYSLHRGRLQQLLFRTVQERLGPEAVRLGHSLRSFALTRAGGVLCEFDDRTGNAAVERCEADALIGADGIHSVVRAAFYPKEGEPRPSGRMLWRATTESAPFLTGRSMIMAGHAAQKFVAYPICADTARSGRSLVNWIAELDLGPDFSLPRRDWNRRGSREAFAGHFAAWRFDWLDIPALVEGAAEIYEFPMVDRDPLPRWSFEAVTLLGDAAHPMYPVGSNGASQAILDAECVAAELKRFRSPGEAFDAYEQKRRPATARVVESNRQHGPEIVMEIVHQRAPNGFTHLGDVISETELQEIADRYKAIAGFTARNLPATNIHLQSSDRTTENV